jgi:pimeloyl-ACP methyl ester carboxylesterase
MKTITRGRWQGTSYRDTGTGPAVMLVHGFPADGTLWDHQVPRLEKDFRLLIPDLPGSGSSPLAGPLSIEDMAEVIREVLDAAGVARPVVIGHSMGGYAALAFAERYPERLAGLGLYHSTAFADSPEKKEGRQRSIQLMRSYGGARFLGQTVQGLFTAAFRKAHPAVLRELVSRAEKAPTGALAYYYEAMRQRPDRTAVLRRAGVPVLFVIGGQDTAVPASDVLKQVSLPAISQVHLWDDAAHMSMLETPDRAAGVLESFVRFCDEYSGPGAPEA